jgi:hypothetical protein
MGDRTYSYRETNAHPWKHCLAVCPTRAVGQCKDTVDADPDLLQLPASSVIFFYIKGYID